MTVSPPKIVSKGYDFKSHAWSDAVAGFFDTVGLNNHASGYSREKLLIQTLENDGRSEGQIHQFFDDMINGIKPLAEKIKANTANLGAVAQPFGLPEVNTVRAALTLTDADLLRSAHNFVETTKLGGHAFDPEAFKNQVLNHWRAEIVRGVEASSPASNPYGKALALDMFHRLDCKEYPEGLLWHQFSKEHVLGKKAVAMFETQASDAANIIEQNKVAAQKALKDIEGSASEIGGQFSLPPGAIRDLAIGLVVTGTAFAASRYLAIKGAEKTNNAQMALQSGDLTPEQTRKAESQISFGKVTSVSAVAMKCFGYYSIFDPLMGGHISKGVVSAWNKLYEAVTSIGRGMR